MRSGIARLATWSWMFKAFTLRDWAIFTQTFGQPIRVGKYGAGASEDDKETLFRAVANIAGDCAAIVPETMQIEFIEVEERRSGHPTSTRSARTGSTGRSRRRCSGRRRRPTRSPAATPSGREHRQVQEDIERADGRAISAILNRDLVRPWIDLEHGPQDAYPRLRVGRAKETDVELVVKSVERMVPLGLKVEKSWMNDLLGIPDPEDGAELLAPRGPAAPAATVPVDGPPARPALQQQARGDGVDRLADTADDLAGPAGDARVDRIQAIVDGAASLEDVRDRLLELDLGGDAFADMLRLAMVYAELSGRDEIAAAGVPEA